MGGVPPSIAAAIGLVAAGGAARGLGEWQAGGGVAFVASILLAWCLWLIASALVAGGGRFLAPRAIRYTWALRWCAIAALPTLLLALRLAPLPPLFETALWGVAHLAMTAAFVVAVREALAVDTTRALLLSVGALALGILALLALGWLLASPRALSS